MFYGFDFGNAAKERHEDLIQQAELNRLARRVMYHQAPQSLWNRWSSAVLIWSGQQLIGWGQQLERPAQPAR